MFLEASAYNFAYLALFLFYLIVPVISMAQPAMTGSVVGPDDQAIVGATIWLQELNRGTVSDQKGEFLFTHIASGSYHLRISSVGFKDQMVQVEHVKNGLVIVMEEEIAELGAVIVDSNREQKQLKKSGFQVEVIDAEVFKDLNMDVNQMLNRTSGVNVREAGGLGSSFNLSLNGLSGNQIRYFLDGVL